MPDGKELEDSYRRNMKTVWNICYPYFMNRADTEDAVQEAFGRLAASGRRFDSEEHEKAWLIVTARNICKDELKRARRLDIPLEETDVYAAPEAPADETLEVLRQLPDRYRTALYLYYYEEWSTAMIAFAMNRRESTVRSDLRRGRSLLKNDWRSKMSTVKDKTREAYDSIAPDAVTEERMRKRIRERMAQSEMHPVPGRGRRKARVIAVCAALAAVLGAVAAAAYDKWHLPEPKTCTVDPENGVYSISTEKEYTADTAAAAEESEALSDAWFIALASEVLEKVGLADIDMSRMTVVRRTNEYWGREEAEVCYTQGEAHTGVTFSAESGDLIGLSGVEWIENAQARKCATAAEAEALARSFYQALPVPQGYELTACSSFDEQYMGFEFCRRIEEGLYNQYEMVRIGINPVNGRLQTVNVFHVPLLDDHGEGDIPLTQEEAETAAQAVRDFKAAGYTLKKAAQETVMPNWFFTEYMTGEMEATAASDVTRLAWVLVYEKETALLTDETRVYADLYTGEILGGDMAG